MGDMEKAATMKPLLENKYILKNNKTKLGKWGTILL